MVPISFKQQPIEYIFKPFSVYWKVDDKYMYDDIIFIITPIVISQSMLKLCVRNNVKNIDIETKYLGDNSPILNKYEKEILIMLCHNEISCLKTSEHYINMFFQEYFLKDILKQYFSRSYLYVYGKV